MQNYVRLIDANAVVSIQTFNEMTEDWGIETLTVSQALDKFADEGCPPTIDAVPVVHARWVKDRERNTYCSHCEKYIPSVHFHEEYQDYESEWDEEIDETEYCPNCGAKMDEGEE